MKLPSRPRSLVTGALSLVLLIAVWALLAPPQLGGQATFVIVNGNSMEPLYHRGDLVLLRTAESYAVGEIVTYRHPQIGPVIHRIIGRNDQRWVFKGDHNNFIDPYQPRDTDLIGRAFIHVPAVGKLVDWLRTQPLGTALAIGAGVFVMLTIGKKRRQQSPVALSSTGHTASLTVGIAGSAALALVALALGGWAYTRPAEQQISEELPYTIAGSFGYHAAAPVGVYDTGAAENGAPIFWQLSDQLDLSFDTRLDADSPAELAGTAQFAAVLRSNDGWQRAIPLSPPQPFTGNIPQLRGSIDLHQVQAMIDVLEKRAGLPRREYLLAITPTIAISGTLDGEALGTTFAPTLTFRSDAFQLTLVRDAGGDPLAPSQGGALTRQQVTENHLLIIPLSVTQSRLLAPVLFTLSLLALAWFCRPLLHIHTNQVTQIQLKYGALLAEMAPGGMLPPREVALTSIDALARLAERHGTMILRDNDRYLVASGDIAYSFTAATPYPVLPSHASVVVSAPPTTTLPWKTAFLAELHTSGHASLACRTVGIGIARAYQERERDLAFAEAWDMARAVSQG